MAVASNSETNGRAAEPQEHPHWISGKPQPSLPGRSGPVWNPATGRRVSSVGFASAEETDEAVAAAQVAFPDWRDTPLAGRTEVMFRFRELLQRDQQAIAEVITAQHGKVLSDASTSSHGAR
ncbi:MAG: aldehyde dehydrogenase family protein [Dehalococcoidia bacterium]